MLMLRMPDADATMFSLPKGASKLPLTIASIGAAQEVWWEPAERGNFLGRVTDLTIARVLVQWTGGFAKGARGVKRWRISA